MHVLITGANRGIGAAMADALAARGDDVTRTSRAGDGDHVALDVTDPAAVAALARGVGDGPLDLLVCNAGVFPDRGEEIATGYPADMWARGFATNVTGVFLTVQALLPNLRKARGKVAIISSQLGSSERASGGNYIYRSSKAAVLNLGRNLAADLKSDGIAVGIYHPGWVRTDMGGEGADLTPEASARNLIKRFDALDLGTSGDFLTHDGRAHPF